MIGSLIVGSLIVLLGACCIVVGLVVAVAQRQAGVGAFGPDEIKSLAKAVAEVLRALAALPVAIQLLVIGVILIGGGVYLLDARPF